MQNFIGVSSTIQNLQKVNDTIQRKHPDRCKDGQKDGSNNGSKYGQTLFYRTLSATAVGPII